MNGLAWESMGARAREIRAEALRHPLMTLLVLVLAVPFASLLLVAFRGLDAPIYGVHDWRQGWTYSVAYAYVYEGTSFFYPKHNWRGYLSGICGMEVPIYPYLLSILIRIFGDAPILGRLINMVLFALAFVLQGRAMARYAGFPSALGWLVMAALSPLVLCEFRQIQPDPMMTALCIVASVLFQAHGQSGSRASFAGGFAIYTIALLTKSIAIAVMPAMYLFAVLGPVRPSARAALLKLLGFALPLALLFAWDSWAQLLVERYMEGHSVISIEHDPAAMLAQARDPGGQRHILLGLLENWVTHVSLFPAVLIGIPLSLRKPLRSLGVPYLAWLLGVVAISLAFSHRYYSNWYYMLLFAPPVLFFGGVSLGALFEVIGKREREPARFHAAVAVVLSSLAVRPLLDELPWDRIEPVDHQIGFHVRQAVSRGEVYWVLIAGALILAASSWSLRDLLLRPAEQLLVALLAVGFFASMVVPFKDVRQGARISTGEFRWEGDKLHQRGVREAVERFSTYQDRFLVGGANPGFLARARRVGFADDPPWIDRMGRNFYVGHGVRFYLSYHDSGGFPQAMQGAQQLAAGPGWELFCIAPEGCPERKR